MERIVSHAILPVVKCFVDEVASCGTPDWLVDAIGGDVEVPLPETSETGT